ncbi:MAG: sel1 repeat family protein [Rhodobacteraceae bacterium]|nr:sel1 repeat family protein [Paracoccaceae bacterium]
MSAMRHFLLTVAIFAGLTTGATAFDGTPTTKQKIGPEDVSPVEALRAGARRYYAGDKAGALTSLRYAAENGQSMAAWKLGEMYATGDGVEEDDMQAFKYYSQIVREHGNDRPDAPDAPFVSSAFVALGKYYMDGISPTVPKDISRARQIFTHAASYFGDADAQFELGNLYDENNSRMAVRWYNLAALKGHIGAQARLGETLFNIGQNDDRRARGLMWISVALEQVRGQRDWDWVSQLHETYFAQANGYVRNLASVMANSWIERNLPSLVNSDELVGSGAAADAALSSSNALQ